MNNKAGWKRLTLLAGSAFFIAGAAVTFYCTLSPSTADVSQALAPIATVPLTEAYADSQVTTQFVIPDTAAWRRIRRSWGEPDFVIVVTTSDRHALCLSRLDLAISITDKGNPVRVAPGSLPYAYSEDCNESGLRFHALPGSSLHLQIAEHERRGITEEQLVVAADWLYFKDDIVGSDLNQKTERAGRAALLLGVVVLAFPVGSSLLSRGRRPHPPTSSLHLGKI
jgi:hypothetical protein